MEENKIIDYNKYCSSNEVFHFKVEDFEFSCEEMTAGEELDFFNDYIDIDTGKENIAKLRLCQATKLINTPFDKNFIKFVFNKFYKVNDINKDWNELNNKQRLLFLKKLDTKLISGILTNITEHYTTKSNSIKN